MKCPRDRSGVSPGAAPREFGRERDRDRATTAPPPDRLPLWGMATYRELDGHAFARAASDAVYILVMHEGEEPGAKVGTPLPATLLGNRPDEGVLDEIVCPGHVAGQRKSIAPQPRDLDRKSVV